MKQMGDFGYPKPSEAKELRRQFDKVAYCFKPVDLHQMKFVLGLESVEEESAPAKRRAIVTARKSARPAKKK